MLSDYYNSTNYDFELVLYNNYPYVRHPQTDPILVHVGTNLVHYLPTDIFADVDRLPEALSISLSQEDGSPIPRWLHFKKSVLMLSGIPQNKDFICVNGSQIINTTQVDEAGVSVPVMYRYCHLRLNLTASDRDDIASHILTIEIYNLIPVWRKPIYEDASGSPRDLEIHVGQKLTSIINKTCFSEFDQGDHLTYELELSQTPGALPTWLLFSQETLILEGLPEANDLLSRCQGHIFEQYPCFFQKPNKSGDLVCVALQKCIYNMTLIVSDQYDQITAVFNITLTNQQPHNNCPLHYDLVNDDEFWRIHLYMYSKYYFPSDAFADEDATDVLRYSAELFSTELNRTEPLPAWLNFVPSLRGFIANPVPSLIGNCYKPDYSEASVYGKNALGESVPLLQRQCKFTLVITADDGYNTTSQLMFIKVVNSHAFNFSVINNVDGIADKQEEDIVVYIKDFTNFFFRRETFTDIDPVDKLVYFLTQADGQPLPGWISFNQEIRRFAFYARPDQI